MRAPRGRPAAWRRRWRREFERAERSLLAVLRRLPPEIRLRPRIQGRWSVKDVLAHIVEWERVAVERLDLVRRGRGGEISFFDEESGERFNREAVARRRAATFARLRRELLDLGLRLRRRLRSLPLFSLADPAHEYPVRDWLWEFTVDHLDHHARRLRELARPVRERGSARPRSRRSRSD